MPFGNAHLPQERLVISDNVDDEKDMDLTYGLALVDEARRWLPSDDDEASSVSAESTSSTNQESLMASSGMKILLADVGATLFAITTGRLVTHRLRVG